MKFDELRAAAAKIDILWEDSTAEFERNISELDDLDIEKGGPLLLNLAIGAAKGS